MISDPHTLLLYVHVMDSPIIQIHTIIVMYLAPETIEDPFVLSVGGYSAITGGCDGENSTEGEQIAGKFVLFVVYIVDL